MNLINFKHREDMRKVADEFDLTLGEDLKSKFDDMREAEAEWARLKKGPMGTVLEEASNQVGETSNETL